MKESNLRSQNFTIYVKKAAESISALRFSVRRYNNYGRSFAKLASNG